MFSFIDLFPSINIKDIYHLPYTDTFLYLFYKDNILSASRNNATERGVKYSSKYLYLTNTSNNGYFRELDPNSVKEVITGNYISKKDAIKIKRYDGYVLKDNIADINGDYYSIYDSNIINSTLDGWTLSCNIIEEAVTGETMDKNNAIFIDKYNGYIHKSNIVQLQDKMYHKKDKNIIFYAATGEWFHISQCYVNYNREKLNKELAKQFLYTHDFEHQNRMPGHIVFREGELIPKKYAIIAYNLTYDTTLNDIIYQEVYCTSTSDLISLTTGELIVNSDANRLYVKKFNGKYYLKKSFKLTDKSQLTLW